MDRLVGDGRRGAVCPTCDGQRLQPGGAGRALRGRTIAELTALSVAAGRATSSRKLQPARARGRRSRATSSPELRTRLAFPARGRAAAIWRSTAPRRRLSGGEAQRIRLAAQLGSNLRGVCYILDEPTIGLHPRDNRHAARHARASWRRKGNTLVVVEHDEETIRRAEHVIDLGPGAGARGGEVVAEGTLERLIARTERSLTGRFLAQPLRHPLSRRGAVRGPTRRASRCAAPSCTT